MRKLIVSLSLVLALSTAAVAGDGIIVGGGDKTSPPPLVTIVLTVIQLMPR